MSCSVSLSLNQAGADNAMDAATFDATDNKIVSIRGNRLFVVDPVSLSILSSLDVGTYARSNGCLAWDGLNNRIWAAAWNCPQFALAGGFQASKRNLYRLHVSGSSLVLDQQLDIGATFGLAANNSAALDVGIMSMHPLGVVTAGIANIYCKWAARPQLGPGTGGAIQFQSLLPTSFSQGNGAVEGGFNNISYGLIGGHDNAIIPDPEGGPQVVLFDYNANVENTITVAAPKTILAVGFASSQSVVYVTDVAQFIYSYATGGAFLRTTDTGRSTFTGLCIRQNPNTGLLYIPGGSDNSVAIIDPTLNGNQGGLSGLVRTGFDAPVDVVFTGSPVGTTSIAVQAGATPFKVIV